MPRPIEKVPSLSWGAKQGHAGTGIGRRIRDQRTHTHQDVLVSLARVADNAPQKLLYDGCDGGWHLRWLGGLKKVPSDSWLCRHCTGVRS